MIAAGRLHRDGSDFCFDAQKVCAALGCVLVGRLILLVLVLYRCWRVNWTAVLPSGNQFELKCIFPAPNTLLDARLEC